MTSGSRTTSVGGVITLLGAFLATALVAGLLGAGLFMPAVGATGAVARGGVHAFDSLPAELKVTPLAQQSRILAADGRVIATFYDEDRIVVPTNKIAPVMRTAIVSIEDDRFYTHGGIDPHGLVRALVNNANGGSTQGASTITQQFVKQTLLENCLADHDLACANAAINRSGTSGYARKLQELKYAVTLEKRMSKDDILTGYLNIAYFGSGTYGVESAALRYFGVHASKLNLQQAALLAGLVQAPSTYDPNNHMAAAVARRNTVLGRMQQLGKITPAQYTAAAKSKIVLHKVVMGNDCNSSPYPYFCDYVRRVLSATDGIGSAALQRGGLTVKTTLQPSVQDAVQKIINRYVPAHNKPKIGMAATTVQPGTGKIISMVQSSTWKKPIVQKKGKKKKKQPWDANQINWNVDNAYGGSNGFQTGSSFKAFTLAAALKDGWKLNDQVLAPGSPANIPGYTNCAGQSIGSFPVSNDEGKSNGSKISLYDATAKSVNTAYAQLERQVSVCKVYQLATSLGVHRAAPQNPKVSKTLKLNQYPTLTLGANEVAPMTMAAAYAAFSAEGTFCKPIAITSITSYGGKKYAAPKADCHEAISPDVADGVTDGLKGVLTYGTASNTTGTIPGRPAVGKTGTTNSNQEAWFVGYTKQLSTAVYMGHPNNPAKPMRGFSLGGRSYGSVFGATLSGPVWKKIIIKTSDVLNLPSESFTRPPSSIVGTKPRPTQTPTGTPTGGPTQGPAGNGNGNGNGGNGNGNGGNGNGNGGNGNGNGKHNPPTPPN